MEVDLNFLGKRKKTSTFKANGRQPKFFRQMEDNLNAIFNEDNLNLFFKKVNFNLIFNEDGLNFLFNVKISTLARHNLC